MILTIDTDRDSLADVLRTVGAAFDVDLPDSAEPTPTKANGRGRRGRSDRPARGGREQSVPSGDPRQIRSWARDNGYEVSNRGALPRSVIDAFAQATSG